MREDTKTNNGNAGPRDALYGDSEEVGLLRADRLQRPAQKMITDSQVEGALEYLRDSAKTAAVARAQAKTMEKYLGVVEAQQKALHGSKSNAAAQDLARASPEYRQALDAWEEAVRRDGEFTMLREAASSRIEAWRSMCANNRIQEKIR